MNGLNLNLLLGVGSDFEQAQYTILAELAASRRAFGRNEIYPHLAGLVDVYHAVGAVLQQGRSLREALPRTLRRIDLQTGDLHYAPAYPSDERMAYLEEVMAWALPHIERTIEEGRTIFDFVEERLRVEQVGLAPLYDEEGYLLVADRAAGVVHVLEYALSIITRAEERFRSLRTVYLYAAPEAEGAPGQIKRRLLAERRMLPNPATYFVEAEVDFPYEPTLLPVAKRKLMQRLCRTPGMA